LLPDRVAAGDAGVAGWISAELQQNVIEPIADFQNPDQEWRRFSELLGTFFLVTVAAGGGMGAAFPNTISRTAAVVAPGLMVLGIIMFMGKVSGAHLNPAVSIAFALRRDFPWRRVPGYIIVQLIGATLAALVLHAVINVSAVHGSNYVASGYSAGAGFWMELLLTLVSVILGTAPRAQNIGIIAALAVGAYIAFAGLWGSPISGASMNRARTFGPDLIGGKFTDYWVYIAGPILGGAVAVAVAVAFVLRGPGGGMSGSAAAQGALYTEAQKREQDLTTEPPMSDPSVKGDG
jgi:aquaporin Z